MIDLQDFYRIIISGLLGTAAMTLVMYAYSMITGINTKVVHILGNMLTASSPEISTDTKSLVTGSIAHIGVGMLFSFSYYLMLDWDWLDREWSDSFWTGLISGILAIIVWKTYIYLHKRPPLLSLPHYQMALILSHIVFGMVTILSFSLIPSA
ncbi:hypothetical protein GCM10007049_17600 [Echinicola pacifica]|uniref:DUF2938 domain-containing protein n=1 Tax=Echinicola pacifica TaxID=346377 RepID=A0A918PXV0_9BACT|nr:DUF6789 family protein [Echinicola pacifica]GGZ25558.1 hypothetical protein GCM10007049_17600 [Echinicola pacifica]